MLGAVRHKGFIPWDNDVDIMIPYEDYHKTLKLLNMELDKDKYFVQNIKSENKFNLLWTKIRANNTTSLPEKHKRFDVHFGVGIDIFPVIGINDNKLIQKIQFSLLGLQRTLISVDFTKTTDRKIIGKYKYICATPRIFEKRHNKTIKFNYNAENWQQKNLYSCRFGFFNSMVSIIHI